jgi:hypothetical protein
VAGVIRTAINGVVAGLAITADAVVGAEVPLYNDAAGTAGNVAITDTVADAGFIVAGMTGGVAGIENNETFTLDDGTNPATVFEYQIDSHFVAAGGGVVAIDISACAADTDVATATRAGINGVGAGLAITASAPSGAAVPLVNDAFGAAGNVAASDTVAYAGFGVTGMSGGSDGILDGETFTLDDGITAATVFEFDTDSSITGGRTAVNIASISSANDIRDAIIAAINGVGATLAITASSGGAATVTLVQDNPEAVGAGTNADTVTDAAFAIAGMDTPTGATSTGYKITYTSSVDGEETAASAEVTEAAGPAVPDANNYVKVTWTTPALVATIKVYRVTGGATQGLIGTVAGVAGAQYLNDTGLVGDETTPNTSNLTGTADAVGVLDLRDKYVQVGGTFTGTIQLQGTVDGTNWVSEGAAHTAAGVVAVAPTYQKMRAVCTAYTSGTATFTLTGHR